MILSMEDNHSEQPININPTEIDQARSTRFRLSAGLRLASSMLQGWGGVTSHQGPLIVEAGEELGDSMFFGAAAVESSYRSKALRQRARKYAKIATITAATFSTLDTSLEIYQDHGALLETMKGINLYSHQYEAALGALAINAVVYWVNRKGRKSVNPSDQFAWRDSIKDSVIPGVVLSLGALQAPHIAEYGFELSGVAYGWYIVKKLFTGWKPKTQKS